MPPALRQSVQEAYAIEEMHHEPCFRIPALIHRNEGSPNPDRQLKVRRNTHLMTVNLHNYYLFLPQHF